jgi:hypothetical protein
MRKEIEAGMQVLDREAPGWEQIVNVGQLNIALDCDCVLGFVYGSYWSGLEMLGEPDNFEWSIAHGFTFRGNDEDGLTDAWKIAIQSRKELGNAS